MAQPAQNKASFAIYFLNFDPTFPGIFHTQKSSSVSLNDFILKSATLSPHFYNFSNKLVLPHFQFSVRNKTNASEETCWLHLSWDGTGA